MGLVLYPDDYDKDPISGSVKTMPEGVVFLPATGLRGGSDVDPGEGDGGYWSSTALGSDMAYLVYFFFYVAPDSYIGRKDGYSVRLVTE